MAGFSRVPDDESEEETDPLVRGTTRTAALVYEENGEDADADGDGGSEDGSVKEEENLDEKPVIKEEDDDEDLYGASPKR